MLEQAQSRPDLFLLLSLLLVIVMYPVLDHGDVRRVILGVLMFVPILLATVRLADQNGLGLADGPTDGSHNSCRDREHVYPFSNAGWTLNGDC